jgi:hypothetical protein
LCCELQECYELRQLGSDAFCDSSLGVSFGVTTFRHRRALRAEDREKRSPWLIPKIERSARVVTPDGCRLRRQVGPVIPQTKENH